ncbi:hypothetical protein LTR85_011839 [Meristemomyces frigidus]|nr:hypothetical protein LTR85_011839 [Meristemomyces frigidus]
MLVRWKQNLTKALAPSRYFNNILPLNETEAHHRSPRLTTSTWTSTLRQRRAASRIFWRAMFLLVLILIVVTLVRPSNHADRNQHRPEIDVDWCQYAYLQSATDEADLCNSLMVFESLVNLGARAERLLLYPEHWIADNDKDTTAGRLLRQARDKYGVRLMPAPLQLFGGDARFQRLLAWNQTQYRRVISLHSAATILQPLDDLFLSLVPAPVSATRAYWRGYEHTEALLSTHLIVVDPSDLEFRHTAGCFTHRNASDLADEVINNCYRDSATIFPHLRYSLETAEFRAEDHQGYVGKGMAWDVDQNLGKFDRASRDNSTTRVQKFTKPAKRRISFTRRLRPAMPVQRLPVLDMPIVEIGTTGFGCTTTSRAVEHGCV